MGTRPLKIAIIGAGPAGCTLARLLLAMPLPSPSCIRPELVIFESDASSDVRSQGGTLDLHVKTGQRALQLAGLHDSFLAEARFDGEAMVVADKRLNRYIQFSKSKPGRGRGRPEIDRCVLRRILLESLPPGVVRWGHRLCHVEVKEDGHHTLHFNDRIETGYDLIVGADGAWSKVRSTVSDSQPMYSGVSGFSFNVRDAAAQHQALWTLVNCGTVFAFSDHLGLIVQQMGDGSLICNAGAVKAEDWLDNLSFDIGNGKQAKAALLKEFEGWDSRLKAAIEAGDEGSFQGRKFYMLPIGMDWDTRAGVTIIGDAAHLATPLSGEGVNIAMEDAIELANAILGTSEENSLRIATHNKLDTYNLGSILTSRIHIFEQQMFVRAKAMQERAWGNLTDMYLREGAPRSGIERWTLRGLEKDIGDRAWLLPVARLLVYVGFWFVKLVI